MNNLYGSQELTRLRIRKWVCDKYHCEDSEIKKTMFERISKREIDRNASSSLLDKGFIGSINELEVLIKITGLSSDYLLGYSSNPSIQLNTNDIKEFTNLNNEAINYLNENPEFNNLLNDLFKSMYGIELLGLLNEYISTFNDRDKESILLLDIFNEIQEYKKNSEFYIYTIVPVSLAKYEKELNELKNQVIDKPSAYKYFHKLDEFDSLKREYRKQLKEYSDFENMVDKALKKTLLSNEDIDIMNKYLNSRNKEMNKLIKENTKKVGNK